MADVIVKGDTSGAVTLSAPAVAGTVTVTLPAASGTMLTTASSTGISGSAISSGTVAEAYGGTGTSTGYYGFKNRIINGAMVIDQRNAGASGTASAFTVDRFAYVSSQASKGTWQQNAGSVTPPAGFKNYLGFTSSSAYSVLAGDYFTFRQGIEGFNTFDLGFGAAGASTVSLSFWVRSSLTGTFGVVLSSGNASRGYPATYTISSANTWEYKTITIPGDTSGTWVGATNAAGMLVDFGLGVGSTYSATANAWGSGNIIGATGATSVVGTNGATFYITGVQLEKGSTATSFDYRPYGTELALCQRYAQYLGFPSGSITASIGRGTSTGGTGVFRVAPNVIVPLRASPSISFSNLVCGVVSTGTVSLSSITTIYYVSGYTEFDGVLASSNGVGGNITTLQTSSSGTSYMLLSSEL